MSYSNKTSRADLPAPRDVQSFKFSTTRSMKIIRVFKILFSSIESIIFSIKIKKYLAAYIWECNKNPKPQLHKKDF